MGVTGEWWLDENGDATFADGDVGDFGHEAFAYCAALGLPLDEDAAQAMDYDGPPSFQIGERLYPVREGADTGDEDDAGNPVFASPQNSLYLWAEENGAPRTALDFFSKPGADARVYAIRYMGWIRVKQDNAEVWTFDDRALRALQRADFWESDWSDSEGRGVYDDVQPEDDFDQEFSVEERSTRRFWTFKVAELHRAKTVRGLLHAEGPARAGTWHGPWQGGEGGFGGLKAKPKAVAAPVCMVCGRAVSAAAGTSLGRRRVHPACKASFLKASASGGWPWRLYR